MREYYYRVVLHIRVSLSRYMEIDWLIVDRK